MLLVIILAQTALAIPTPEEWWVQLTGLDNATGVSTSQDGVANYISVQVDMKNGSGTIIESAFDQDWYYYKVRATTAQNSHGESAVGYHRWVIGSSSYYEITNAS